MPPKFIVLGNECPSQKKFHRRAKRTHICSHQIRELEDSQFLDLFGYVKDKKRHADPASTYKQEIRKVNTQLISVTKHLINGKTKKASNIIKEIENQMWKYSDDKKKY